LAARQYGVVSATQLAAAGLSKDAISRRAVSGRLHRLYRGVYAVGHDALPERGRLLAAVLACGPDAVLSHRSAGWLWAILPSARRIEVTSPRRRTARGDLAVHRSSELDDEDRTVLDEIPVTTVARTLVDLAEVLPEDRLARAVHETEVRRSFDLRAIERTLARLPGRRGRHQLRRVLAGYRPDRYDLESEAERRFLELCRRLTLPEPQNGVLLEGYRVDFYWPHARLAVEVDGVAFHHTRRAFHDDRRRDRALATAGVQVARVTWRDLDQPAALARELEDIVATRS
jgi:very-short-patch-repair endonuclease